MAKVTIEVPGEYVMVNSHGTARRRFPKIKGKKAVKQARKLRHMLHKAKVSSMKVKEPSLMSPSKDETREK